MNSNSSFFEEILETFPAGRVASGIAIVPRGDSVFPRGPWSALLCSSGLLCSFRSFLQQKNDVQLELFFCLKDFRDIDFRFGSSNLILEFHCLELEILESNQPDYFRLESNWLLLEHFGTNKTVIKPAMKLRFHAQIGWMYSAWWQQLFFPQRNRYW